jgi:hypothetical protein
MVKMWIAVISVRGLTHVHLVSCVTARKRMIIDIAEKILNRLVAYRDAKKRRRSELLREVAEPLFLDLGKIHEMYLTAFRGFRRELADGMADVDSILGRVHEERLFTEAIRTRVRAIATESSDETEFSELAALCNSVRNYLTLPNDDRHLDALHYCDFQRWFTEYILVLYVVGRHDRNLPLPVEGLPLWAYAPPLPMLLTLGDHTIESELERHKSDRRSAAIALLDALVMSMEHEYARVCTAYARARVVLLQK